MVAAAYLNTRGRERHRDYQFIGPAPPSTWWRAYADHTTFERPTVLVQSDGQGWQAYLSGIPSRRRDAVGTVIRYTVVAEGSPDQLGPAGLGTGDVLALVANWLADQDLARGVGRVSEALDAAFPEPDVERLFGTEPDGNSPAGLEVGRRLGAALHQLRLPDPGEPAPAPAALPDGWLGDVNRPAARAAFLLRVDALLAGQPGRALVLNLIGAAADLSGLVDDPRPLAVLAPDLPEPDTIVTLGREPAKKAPPPPGTTPPEPAVTPASPIPASPIPASPIPASPIPASKITASKITASPPPSAMRNLRGCLRLILVPIALLMALALALFGTLFYLR